MAVTVGKSGEPIVTRRVGSCRATQKTVVSEDPEATSDESFALHVNQVLYP